MSEPRFTVERACVSPGYGVPPVEGWAVFDRDGNHDRPFTLGRRRRSPRLRITIAWANYEEAEQHRDNIDAYYAEKGW